MEPRPPAPRRGGGLRARRHRLDLPHHGAEERGLPARRARRMKEPEGEPSHEGGGGHRRPHPQRMPEVAAGRPGRLEQQEQRHVVVEGLDLQPGNAGRHPAEEDEGEHGEDHRRPTAEMRPDEPAAGDGERGSQRLAHGDPGQDREGIVRGRDGRDHDRRPEHDHRPARPARRHPDGVDGEHGERRPHPGLAPRRPVPMEGERSRRSVGGRTLVAAGERGAEAGERPAQLGLGPPRRLGEAARPALGFLADQLRATHARITTVTTRIETAQRENPFAPSRRRAWHRSDHRERARGEDTGCPGLPIGTGYAAWLSLPSKAPSSGGKERRGGISKTGKRVELVHDGGVEGVHGVRTR